MYLKKLELSGFKSFARSTGLEFPLKITAIVGPNGSGKSNIVEALRWVMGEQSMKSLRSKRGEDIIFNGSPKAPRLGKASVELIFDNSDQKIPLDFSEVSLGRKIFRDGLGEYFINNSQVRLKDLVELLAKMGLGETKHNIINQGEVDKMLLAPLRDRKAMLEEALGLRIYHLKKNEAQRKLDSSEENIKQAESLIREITPHLKFLRSQAQKAEARGNVENELKNLQKIYFTIEARDIEKDKSELVRRRRPLEEKISATDKETARITSVISEKEGELRSLETVDEKEKELLGLESERRELERELGRLEGRIALERERSSTPLVRLVDAAYLQGKISDFIKDITALLGEEDRMEAFRENIRILKEDLEGLLEEIKKGKVEEKRSLVQESLISLEKEIAKATDRLSILAKEMEEKRGRYRLRENAWKKIQAQIREEERRLRVADEEKRDLLISLQRFDFDKERVEIREQEFYQDLRNAGWDESHFKAASLDGYEEALPSDLKKKMERLKGKLEEIGGIDPLVVKEYQDTQSRHEFLTREIEDLKKASFSLTELIDELDQHIKNDFEIGFIKIGDEFNNYFRIIFGGGSAKLQIVKSIRPQPSAVADEEDFSEENGVKTEEGVDIDVNLPKKRIKGLAMLSGGERALTSIALLFAITAVNPPPFLVLDETDAALDEANSQRYAAILKELSKKTQLILVTHNRETMASAGILYGVTMGDDGVSKLLSLRLEEAEVYTNR